MIPNLSKNESTVNQHDSIFSQNLGWERPTIVEHARSLFLHFQLFSELVLRFSGMVLAGVLPAAGQIFEKWHLLENVERFLTTLGSIFNHPGVHRAFMS